MINNLFYNRTSTQQCYTKLAIQLSPFKDRVYQPGKKTCIQGWCIVSVQMGIFAEEYFFFIGKISEPVLQQKKEVNMKINFIMSNKFFSNQNF